MKKTLMNEPVISVQTSAKVSFNRALERDQTAMNYVNFQSAKKLQDIFDNQTMLGIGEVYTDSLLSRASAL